MRVNMEKTEIVIFREEPMIRMRVGDIRVGAVEEGWERIWCAVQDVKGGVIRNVWV